MSPPHAPRILDGSPPLHRHRAAADDGSGPPVRPPRRPAAAHPLLRAGQSRRWPGLRATSGAVNLDTRSYDRAHGRDLSFEKRASFLAVDVVAENPGEIYFFLHDPDCYSPEGYDMLAGVLANPAAQHVQELRIGVASSGFGAGGAHGIDFRLSFGALPSRDLRLLHITNCTDLAPPPPGMAFPLLAELVLLGCTTSLGGLQGMIGAAPQLAVLHLEHTQLTGASQSQYVEEEADDGVVQTICTERYLLSSPTVTSLVLAKCGWPEFAEGSVTLDMPMLRCFKYHGLVHRFSLKPKAPNNMTRADLHFAQEPRSAQTPQSLLEISSELRQRKVPEAGTRAPDRVHCCCYREEPAAALGWEGVQQPRAPRARRTPQAGDQDRGGGDSELAAVLSSAS